MQLAPFVLEEIADPDSAHSRPSDMVSRSSRGVVAMQYYRLYFMDRFSGHIDQYREFEAASDEAAMAIALDWREDRPMELWSHHRKLKHWDVAPIADA